MQDERQDYSVIIIFATNEINNEIDRGKLDTDFVQLTFNIV